MSYSPQAVIDEALTKRCGLCKAQVGEACRNLFGGAVITEVHMYRVENARWIQPLKGTA